MPKVPKDPKLALSALIDSGVTWGDSADWLPALPHGAVDLFFMSPPYAEARAYSPEKS